MTKEERLAFIKKRFKELDGVVTADAVMPATKRDIAEEVQLMEAAREYERDKRTQQHLND